MSFCPECRAEYELGIAKCADCDVPLVNELPKEPEPYCGLAAIAEVYDETAAIFYCDMLSQAGIDATYRSFSVPGYGDIVRELEPFWGEVLVLDKDADKAEQIITEYLKSIEEKPILEDEEDI
jgi:hypothetical protein